MRWFALPLMAACLAVLAACGGDDDGATTGTAAALTPIGTKQETPTPVPADGSAAPEPPVPQLDEALTEITSGRLVRAMEPAGLPLDIDPGGSIEELCGNLAFGFTWQVQDPYPPDGVDLLWRFTRQGATIEIANAPSGEQTVGCGLLEAVNRGSGEITLVVRYRVGAIPVATP